MNIEDGDELPIQVAFEEENDGSYWYCQLAALPAVGDTVIIGSAPKGVRHVVKRTEHHVGGARHRIVIIVARRLKPAQSRNHGRKHP